MNGIGLLLYVLAVGQVNSGHAPALPPFGTLAGATAAVDSNVYDYGWDIDLDGSLYYIMQIAPAEAQEMEAQQLNPEGSEKWSDMPKELIGRVRRISIRVGNAPLPRNPSLQEISRRPLLNARDVTAALDAMMTPQDRLSDVELPPVVNVQGQGGSSLFSQLSNPNRAPAPDYSGSRDPRGLGLPAGPTNQSNPNGAASATGAGASGNFGSAFLDATGGAGTGISGLPYQPLVGTPNKYQDADSTGTNAAVGTQWSAPRDPYSLPGSSAADGRGNVGANAAPVTAPGLGGIPSSSGVFPGLERQQTPAPGFGSAQGSQSGSMADRFSAQSRPGYGAESYGASGATAPGYSSADATRGLAYSQQDWDRLERARRMQLANQYADESARLASNQSPARSLPSTEQVLPKDLTPQTASTGQTSDSGTQTNTGSQTGRANSSTEGIIQVFFLLSLVVNFYLGMLIRKLLARYRTLLSNVRSQTA